MVCHACILLPRALLLTTTDNEPPAIWALSVLLDKHINTQNSHFLWDVTNNPWHVLKYQSSVYGSNLVVWSMGDNDSHLPLLVLCPLLANPCKCTVFGWKPLDIRVEQKHLAEMLFWLPPCLALKSKPTSSTMSVADQPRLFHLGHPAAQECCCKITLNLSHGRYEKILEWMLVQNKSSQH